MAALVWFLFQLINTPIIINFNRPTENAVHFIILHIVDKSIFLALFVPEKGAHH